MPRSCGKWRLPNCARLAKLFANYALAPGKDTEGIAMEHERALRAPLTVAAVARIDLGQALSNW
jgi:hypothetical protein